MRRIVIGLALYFALFGMSALVGKAQRPDPTGQDRYSIETNNSIFTQPQYVNERSLDGLGLASATELKVVGRKVYNEYPGGPKVVTLHPDAMIYYDTGSLELMYLKGCIVNGRKRPNRIKLIEEVVTVEKEKIVEKRIEVPVTVEKIVEKRIEVPAECPGCPPDAALSVFASAHARYAGGLRNTAISAGAACVISGLLNKSLRDCAVDAAISAGTNRVAQAVNPSPDSVRATCEGVTQTFRKGKGGPVGGCSLEWEGSTAVLSYKGVECKARELYTNFNMTVFAIKRNGGTRTPVKTQTTVPNRGGISGNNGGQIPGGGVPVIPGNGIPTRPRLGNSFTGGTKTNGKPPIIM